MVSLLKFLEVFFATFVHLYSQEISAPLYLIHIWGGMHEIKNCYR